jgi:hypothetical protein
MVLEKPERTGRATARLTSEEMAMLEALMKATGLSASDVMRQALRQAFQAFEASKPKPKH